MEKQNKEIIVYTMAGCPYCLAAKRLLKSKGVDFKEADVTGDDEAREKLVLMSGGRETLPQIFVNGKSIGGYDDLVAWYGAGNKL